jgi:hypothetical protein
MSWILTQIQDTTEKYFTDSVGFEVLTAAMMMMLFSPQNGDGMFLQNVDTSVPTYTAPQPGRTTQSFRDCIKFSNV